MQINMSEAQCCGSETFFSDPDPTFQIISDPVPDPDPVSDPAYFREKQAHFVQKFLPLNCLQRVLGQIFQLVFIKYINKIGTNKMVL